MFEMYTLVNIRPYGYNVGNQAIRFALQNMIYEVFGRLVTIVEYPATSKHGGIKAGLTAATINEINRCADGVIVGGGNLYENNELDIDTVALKNLMPPLMLFSLSRGKIYNRFDSLVDRTDTMSDEKIKALLSFSSLSFSRDTATHKHLKQLNEKDRLGWCPTIGLDRYSKFLPPLPETEDVGALISIRTPTLMNIPFKYQARIQSDIEHAILELKKNGYKRVRILCNDSRDLDFSTIFRDTMGVDSFFTNDVYLYLSLIKKAQFLVSYRLHASLPAISYGTPSLNFVYDERAKSLFNDLGLTDQYINIIEAGDNLKFIVSQKLSLGPKSSIIDVEKLDWQDKIQAQKNAILEFKSLIDHYLQKN